VGGERRAVLAGRGVGLGKHGGVELRDNAASNYKGEA
jgi:hypothetical protein